jgi:hypothetical protein
VNKLATTVLTPEHPRWREFCDRLAGPDGCAFTEEGTWHCSGAATYEYARPLLAEFGMDADATLVYFRTLGGCCDCEILFNVDPDEGAAE